MIHGLTPETTCKNKLHGTLAFQFSKPSELEQENELFAPALASISVE